MNDQATPKLLPLEPEITKAHRPERYCAQRRRGMNCFGVSDQSRRDKRSLRWTSAKRGRLEALERAHRTMSVRVLCRSNQLERASNKR